MSEYQLSSHNEGGARKFWFPGASWGEKDDRTSRPIWSFRTTGGQRPTIMWDHLHSLGLDTLPQEAELVYSGRAGATRISHKEGAANYLCMPDNPDYLNVEFKIVRITSVE